MVNSEKTWTLSLSLLTLHSKLPCGTEADHFMMYVNEWIRALFDSSPRWGLFEKTWLDKEMGLTFCQMVIEFFFFSISCVCVRVCARPVKGLGMSIFMLLSSFSFGSAYAANLAFMIISTLSSAGGSLGIFRQKWLNWISAQTQCLNGFMDGINWAAAKESHIYVFEL